MYLKFIPNPGVALGVKLFLHELYPSTLTANKESTAKQTKKGNKRKKSIHSPTSIPFPSVLNNRYKRNRRPLLMAKSFAESTSTVNELATQIVLPSPSGKELNSNKDTHLATTQGIDSTSKPDSKSKDGSIDPPQNRGDENDPKENQDDNSQSEHGSNQGNETDPKSLAHPKCSWSISSKGCQLPGVEPKMCVV